MLKKVLLALCIGGLSLTACAAENDAAPVASQAVTPAAQQLVRQAIHSLAANVQVDSIEPAPMPGFYQVIAAGQLLYVSTDGKYAMHGDVMNRSTNVANGGWRSMRSFAAYRRPTETSFCFDTRKNSAMKRSQR